VSASHSKRQPISRLIPVRRARPKEVGLYEEEAAEFDRRFDEGEDIHDIVDPDYR
jgi:hypothetical protein